VAPRAFWKGYLKLALVSCRIALFRTAGQLVGEPLVPIDRAKSGEGEADEGEPEALPTEGVIEIEQFVAMEEIGGRYLDDTYYIVPDRAEGREAFAVIREAIRNKGVVGIGKVQLRSGERIIALQAWGKAMVGTTLRLAHEVEAGNEYFDRFPDLNLPQEMIELAQHIVSTKTVPFEPERLADQILGPITRERPDLQKRDGLNAVPASDRMVRIDHNSPNI
jgi:DNA end-binding protein Ku